MIGFGKHRSESPLHATGLFNLYLINYQVLHTGRSNVNDDYPISGISLEKTTMGKYLRVITEKSLMTSLHQILIDESEMT